MKFYSSHTHSHTAHTRQRHQNASARDYGEYIFFFVRFSSFAVLCLVEVTKKNDENRYIYCAFTNHDYDLAFDTKIKI